MAFHSLAFTSSVRTLKTVELCFSVKFFHEKIEIESFPFGSDGSVERVTFSINDR